MTKNVQPMTNMDQDNCEWFWSVQKGFGGFDGGAGFGGFEDMFSASLVVLLVTNVTSSDLQYRVDISFRRAIFGAEGLLQS